MRRIFYLLTLLLLLASCGGKNKGFTLEGRFRNMDAAELLIYNLNGMYADVDTIVVRNGEFLYSGRAGNDVAAFIIVFPNAVEQVVFAANGQKLEYEATGNDLKNYVVKGNEENEQMNKFRKDTSKANALQTREAAKQFIQRNSNSVVSIYLFDRYFVQDESAPRESIVSLLQLLLKNHPKNLLLLDVQMQLKAADKHAKGQRLPNITLTTQTDHTLHLQKLRRPYTAFVFWATWMDHMWEYMDGVRRIYSDNREQGKLDVVAVSVDTDHGRYDDTIELDRDSVSIQHVCDFKGWDTPLAKRTGMKQIPSFLIADRTGTILATGTTKDELRHAVDSLLKPTK